MELFLPKDTLLFAIGSSSYPTTSWKLVPMPFDVSCLDLDVVSGSVHHHHHITREVIESFWSCYIPNVVFQYLTRTSDDFLESLLLRNAHENFLISTDFRVLPILYTRLEHLL